MRKKRPKLRETRPLPPHCIHSKTVAGPQAHPILHTRHSTVSHIGNITKFGGVFVIVYGLVHRQEHRTTQELREKDQGNTDGSIDRVILLRDSQ
jgi:hypothetical protein